MADFLTPLLARRLLFVTGKGGTGKSTVAATLGLLAARREIRTVVAELDERGNMPRLFGKPLRDGPLELERDLWWLHIDPQEVMQAYLTTQLPLRAVAEMLVRNRAFGQLAAIAPGLREALALGRVCGLARLIPPTGDEEEFDLVIVDAPATGHALGLLGAPRLIRKLAQTGPVAGRSRAVERVVADPALTGVVAVCAPEEPAIDETLELRERLSRELGMELTAVIVNGVHPWQLRSRDVGALRAALEIADPSGPVRHALEVALLKHRLVSDQRAQLQRLLTHLDEPAAELPFLPTEALDRGHLEQLGMAAMAA